MITLIILWFLFGLFGYAGFIGYFAREYPGIPIEWTDRLPAALMIILGPIGLAGHMVASYCCGGGFFFQRHGLKL